MEESRDLLILATCRIFANLARLQPSLDLEAVTAPIDLSCRTAVSNRMRKATEAYAKKFDQVEVEEDEDDGEEDATGRRKTPRGRRGYLRRPDGLSSLLQLDVHGAHIILAFCLQTL